MAPIYQLRDIAHSYGQRTVLRLPQLDIARGETLAVVGPSGAGKSTLLRLLNLLEPPTTGTIAFDGVPVLDPSAPPLALRRRITTVFQRPALLSASVLENVQYGLRLRGAPNAQARAERALERIGLAHLARAHARRLSGGEMQRVALARAMVLEPDVLLLDEATANLDPANVQQIEAAIAELRRAQGTTLVLVTHNLFQARRLATRVALLLDGQLVGVEQVDSFFESPRDPRAAAFVRGEMVY